MCRVYITPNQVSLDSRTLIGGHDRKRSQLYTWYHDANEAKILWLLGLAPFPSLSCSFPLFVGAIAVFLRAGPWEPLYLQM